MSLRFIHISDSHIGSSRDYRLYDTSSYDHLKALVQHLNDLPFEPDFILHTGDVTADFDPAATQLAASLLDELKYPVYYVVGNHDSRSAMRQHLLKQPASDDRLYYDFLQDDFHFLVLDTDGEPAPEGTITKEQLEWLADKCNYSVAKSLVLCIHHLPMQVDVPWMDRMMRINNAEAMYDILIPHRDRLRGVFFGHIHRAFTGFKHGILHSCAPSSFAQFYMYPNHDEPQHDPNTSGGYALVSMTHKRTLISHHYFSVED